MLCCLFPSLMNSLYAIWISKSISGSSSSSTKSSDSSLLERSVGVKETIATNNFLKLTQWCHQCWLHSLRDSSRSWIPPRWWFVRRDRKRQDYRCSFVGDDRATRTTTVSGFPLRQLKTHDRHHNRKINLSQRNSPSFLPQLSTNKSTTDWINRFVWMFCSSAISLSCMIASSTSVGFSFCKSYPDSWGWQ